MSNNFSKIEKKNLMNNDSLCLKSHHSLSKKKFDLKKRMKKNAFERMMSKES